MPRRACWCRWIAPTSRPPPGPSSTPSAAGRSITREGGSIPIVTTFHQQLGADVLLLGWGQEDDNCHSPNEKFTLADFHRGIKASAKLWEELSIR